MADFPTDPSPIIAIEVESILGRMSHLSNRLARRAKRNCNQIKTLTLIDTLETAFKIALYEITITTELFIHCLVRMASKRSTCDMYSVLLRKDKTKPT